MEGYTKVGRVAFVYRGEYNPNGIIYNRYDVVLIPNKGLYHCLVNDWESTEWSALGPEDVCDDPKDDIRNGYVWALFLPMTDVYQFMKDHLKSDETIDITFFDEESETPVNPGDEGYHDIQLNVNPSALTFTDGIVTVDTFSPQSWAKGDDLTGQSVIDVVKELLCPYVGPKNGTLVTTVNKCVIDTLPSKFDVTASVVLGTTPCTITIKDASGNVLATSKLSGSLDDTKTLNATFTFTSTNPNTKSTSCTATFTPDKSSSGKGGESLPNATCYYNVYNPIYKVESDKTFDAVTAADIESMGYVFNKNGAQSYSQTDSTIKITKTSTKVIGLACKNNGFAISNVTNYLAGVETFKSKKVGDYIFWYKTVDAATTAYWIKSLTITNGNTKL